MKFILHFDVIIYVSKINDIDFRKKWNSVI